MSPRLARDHHVVIITRGPTNIRGEASSLCCEFPNLLSIGHSWYTGREFDRGTFSNESRWITYWDRPQNPLPQIIKHAQSSQMDGVFLLIANASPYVDRPLTRKQTTTRVEERTTYRQEEQHMDNISRYSRGTSSSGRGVSHLIHSLRR